MSPASVVLIALGAFVAGAGVMALLLGSVLVAIVLYLSDASKEGI